MALSVKTHTAGYYHNNNEMSVIKQSLRKDERDKRERQLSRREKAHTEN